MKITDIKIHEISLPYHDWLAYPERIDSDRIIAELLDTIEEPSAGLA